MQVDLDSLDDHPRSKVFLRESEESLCGVFEVQTREGCLRAPGCHDVEVFPFDLSGDPARIRRCRVGRLRVGKRDEVNGAEYRVSGVRKSSRPAWVIAESDFLKR